MTQGERSGLIWLVVILLLSTLALGYLTVGGGNFGNIFANIIQYTYERPAPSEENLATFETFKQQVGSYWLIASTTGFTAVLTMASIALYLLFKRQIPRAWCLLLAVLGSVMVILALLSGKLQSDILAQSISCTCRNDGLAAGAEMLKSLGVPGAGFVLIGLAFAAGQIVRQKTGLE